MPDYLESEIRDRLMFCNVVATNGFVPIRDALAPVPAATLTFENKKRNVCALSLSNKTAAPCVVGIYFGIKKIAEYTLPANTLPQLPPIVTPLKSPIFSILGNHDDGLLVTCDVINGADVGMSFWDEP